MEYMEIILAPVTQMDSIARTVYDFQCEIVGLYTLLSGKYNA